MPTIDLNPHDLEIVLAILHKFVPDREVWAFGSRVRWTAKQFSDLDLAVIGDAPLSSNVAVDLAEAFDESELPIKVDVVDWATTSESFRKIIEKDKVIVQAKAGGISRASAVSPAPTFAEENGGPSKIGASLAGWNEMRLGDLIHVKHGWPFKSELFSDELSGKPIVVGIGNFNYSGGFRLDSTTWKEYRGSYPKEYELSPGDILLVMTCQTSGGEILGIPARIPDDRFKYLHNQRLGKVEVLDGNRVFPAFLYWLFLTPEFNRELCLSASGTKILHTAPSRIEACRFLFPPLSDQRAIAAVLDSLNNKIEINMRQKATVEAIGTTLFQSWFIDFDPVQAKADACQPYGLNSATASLFPQRFEDSDLGEIPAGWSATTLSDIVMERTAKVGSGNAHVVLSAVASGELKHSDEHFTKQVYSQDTSKYKRVEQWDYAYNPSRINIGSIGMLEEPIVGAVSPVYAVLRPAQSYEWFLRFFLDLPQTKEVINQFCSGSVRQSLSFKDFAAIPVVLPPKGIAEAFSQRWQELNALRQQLEVESAKLAEVRDTLLPKLMSGELRVPDELMA